MTRKERPLVQMSIEDVRVVGRYRKDLGDLDALAKSIAAVGLLNPITVTSDGQLIAGQRRLEAARLIGWTEIGCLVADDLDTAVQQLTAERDENTERKQMTPQELVALGRALEELEQPKAAQRQAEARSRAGKIRQGTYSSASSSRELDAEEAGQAREKVANALGISATTYDRAKAVVKAAEDATLPAAEREVAQAALTDMNATGNVAGNYEKVRGMRDPRLITRQKPVIQDVKKQRHAIGGAVASLSGIAVGLKRIEELHPEITSEEAALWVGDLSQARRVIEQLIKRLKERSNG